jgi:large repetitive protein
MNRLLTTLILIICPFVLDAQSYNPYVSGADVSPKPIWPVEAGGTGTLSFNIGNTGSDPLIVYTGNQITLTITISNGEPDNADPLQALSGTSRNLFDWTYNSLTKTYSGLQTSIISANSVGSVTIAYKVTQNSTSGTPLNGLNVNLTPAAYQTTSNSTNDDFTSIYTWTEIRDYGDAPTSYGSADHVLDYTNYLGTLLDGESANQPSPAAAADDSNNLDDEDGVSFPSLFQGTSANIPVTVVGMGRLNAWIDWNGDGDFADTGEQIASNVGRFDGTSDLVVTVPLSAYISGPTFARFRFSPGTLSSSTGSAVGGEVEDYRVTIGCAIPAAPTSVTATPAAVCLGASTNLNGTSASNTIRWYTVSSGGTSIGSSASGANFAVTPLVTTIYYAEAYTSLGCASSTRTAVTVTVNAVPAAPASVTATPAAVCAGASSNLNGTSSGNTIRWYTSASGGTSIGSSASGANFAVTPSGTTIYYAEAYTSSGCTSSSRTAVTVTVNALPVVDAGTNQTIPYGTSTTLNATVTGTGLSYSWDPAASLVNATVVDPTTVNLTATTLFTLTATSNSCSASDQVTVTVTGGALSAAATATPSTVCAGASVQLSAGASGGTGTYTYSWTSLPAGFTSSAASPTVTPAVNTTYYVAVGDGITTVNSNVPVTVNAVPAQPTITAGGSRTFCEGGSVTLTSSAGSTYLWSNEAVSQSINVTTSGNYTVQVTNSSGCQSVLSASTAVTVNPVPAQPTITAGSSTTLCTGGSVTLTSSAGVTYLWSTGATTQSIDVSTAGNYTVQVISGAGCQSIASVPITVTVNTLPTPPTITAGGATTFCAGGSVTLTSSIGSSYLWSTGATTPSINVTASGSYTVRVTNASGCQSLASAATNVTVNALPAQPTITAGGSRTFCEGGSVTLSSSAGTTYLWSTSETTQSINVTTTGSYTVRVTNAAGCQSIASAATAVTVNPLPVVNAGTDVSVFNGGSTTLNATVTGTSPFAYSWAPSNLLENASVEDPKTVSLSSTTTFTLTATSTTTTCSNSDAVIITVTGGPLSSVPTAIPSTVCAGSSVQLAAVASGGSGTYTYNWTSLPAGFTSSVANPTASPAVNTIYYVAVNDGVFTVNSQVPVTVNALPAQPVISTTGSATFCAGSSVTLTSSAGTTYLWSTGATTQSINVNTSGNFTVRVTNASGCQSIPSNVLTTVVNALPSAPIVGQITPPTCGLATGSVLLMGLPSTGTWTITRYPGTITLDGSGASFTVEGLNSGIYNYSVTNSSGCTSTLSANVNIPAQPATPSTPVVGTVTQPTYTVPTGSVILSGLPVSGSWTLTILPGGATINASGSSRTVTGLDPGTYNFTVTNTAGCVSLPTANVVINARPGIPNLVINNPPTICSDQTTDLTLPAVTAGSDENLTYTYWTDATATIAYATPTAATPGTYYIRGTSTAGFYNTKPVVVTADQLPIANAGLDQVLDFTFGTTLNADLPEIGVGLWSLVTGAGEIFNSAAPATEVNGLALGDNVFRWSVTNGVCEPVTDDVMIKVNDLIIPTLITPNGDSRNDYFVLQGLESLGTTELVIFDRRGMKVYENSEYDNTWEGLDYNSNPLPDDTYFYVIKTASGKSLSGYIVVRR